MNETDLPVRLAVELRKLGVSGAAVEDLLTKYPYELIEKQLRYLPFRKAKRPEAIIIESIRKNYSAPNAFSHAQSQIDYSSRTLDQNLELPD